MTGRKMLMVGALALIGLGAFDTDAQACKRKRRDRGDDCVAPAPCDPCGAHGHAMASPYGGVPLAMPVPGFGAVIPAEGYSDGTRIILSGGVPSESYYFDSRPGGYYPRSGINAGTTYYPGYTPANNSGRGRMFRR